MIFSSKSLFRVKVIFKNTAKQILNEFGYNETFYFGTNYVDLYEV